MAPRVEPLEQCGVRGVADWVAGRKESQGGLEAEDRRDGRHPLDRDLGRGPTLNSAVLRPRDPGRRRDHSL